MNQMYTVATFVVTHIVLTSAHTSHGFIRYYKFYTKHAAILIKKATKLNTS